MMIIKAVTPGGMTVNRFSLLDTREATPVFHISLPGGACVKQPKSVTEALALPAASAGYEPLMRIDGISPGASASEPGKSGRRILVTR